MATPHHPRRGSMGYYPRVRAKKLQGDIRSWPETDGNPKLQAFAGYKVGMTHVEVVDYRKSSVTAGQNIMMPVTVLEVPPLSVVAIRYYEESEEGLFISGEKWAKETDKNLQRRLPPRKKDASAPEVTNVADVRLIVHTNPSKITGVPSKAPEIFEIRIGGSDLSAKMKYAEEKLGKEISFSDFSAAGNFVDVIGVTKGKGFQGHVKRFGVKLLPKKNRKHRRMIGTLGPWHPDWVRNTVPQAGQVGTHQRTVHNIRVIRYAKNENEMDVNVKGGYPGYGLVRTDYVLLHGSIPGPNKRLIKLREPARQKSPAVNNLSVSYVSRESKQGD